MSIKFSCASCGHHLKANPDQAGKHCKCTRCGHVMTVPAPAALPVAAVGSPPASPAKRQSRFRLFLSASVAGVALVAAVLLAVSLYVRTHEVDLKLADLAGNVPAARSQAVVWLAEAVPQDNRRGQVTAALEPLVVEGDVREQLDSDLVLRAYLHWANQDNVPALIRMVEVHPRSSWSNGKTGQVMIALGKLQDKRAADVLAQRLIDPKLHDQAVDALKLLGPDGQEAVIPFVFADEPDTRQRAEKLLASYGTTQRAVFAEARRRLLSNDQEELHSALAWFAENAPDDDAEKADVAAPLAALLGDHSSKVNHLALRSLKRWANKDCLLQVVAFADRQEKAEKTKESAANNAALIDLLAQFPDEKAADAVALWLKDPEQRSQAVQALLKMGPAATEPVLKHINHSDADVRKEALSLCNRLKIPADRQLEQTLADVADARKPRSRAALQHLAQLRPDEANRAKVSAALNAPLLDMDAGIREAAVDAVRVWATKENTTNLLKLQDKLCAEPKLDGACLDRISQVLISVGSDVQDAVIPRLKSPLVPVRVEACRILAEVGTDKGAQALNDAGNAWQPVDPTFYNYTQLAIAKIAARK